MSQNSKEQGLAAVRSAAVMAAADLLEGLAQAQRLKRRLSSQPPGQAAQVPAQRGDLLFDLMRLNADYLTRLSELSRAHRDLAMRSMERVYAALSPASPQRGQAELCFGGADAIWQRDFIVENTFAVAPVMLELTCTLFQGPKPSKPLPVRSVFSADAEVLVDHRLLLEYRRPKTLTLTLNPADFAAQRVFRSEICLRLGERSRRIALRVDARGGQV